MKKILSLFLTAVLVLGLGAFVFAESENNLEDQPYSREELREKFDQLKAIRETIKDQRETISEKAQTIRDHRRNARKDRDWEALETIREYRKTNIDIRIKKLELKKDRLDVFDLLDQARANRDMELALEALDQLIELANKDIEYNKEIIENMDNCIEELQQ